MSIVSILHPNPQEYSTFWIYFLPWDRVPCEHGLTWIGWRTGEGIWLKYFLFSVEYSQNTMQIWTGSQLLDFGDFVKSRSLTDGQGFSPVAHSILSMYDALGLKLSSQIGNKKKKKKHSLIMNLFPLSLLYDLEWYLAEVPMILEGTPAWKIIYVEFSCLTNFSEI